MDLSGYSISELIGLYSQTIKELKTRGVLRTKNVVGELGEYLVFEEYYKNPSLPNLNPVPVGTKNINAISQSGERYSIKSTTGNVTGVFYGLQPPESKDKDPVLFEYVVLCLLDDDCELNAIYQLSWEEFEKHKKWHSRMRAWNLAITKALKEDALIIFEKENNDYDLQITSEGERGNSDIREKGEIEISKPVVWNKTEKVDHKKVRLEVMARLTNLFKTSFDKTSQSRYVSLDKESAILVLSATYSQKNSEYWYSINDENLPWLELFPKCHIAFALGSSREVLLFDYKQLKQMLQGCLKTREDEEIGKKAHYHIAFAVEGNGRVYFKKKKPERDFIDVTSALCLED